MDRATLEDLLKAADSLLQRGEQSIAFQREMVAKLERGGHDVTAAKMFLRRLDSRQARHIADRNRLFKELADALADPRSDRQPLWMGDVGSSWATNAKQPPAS